MSTPPRKILYRGVRYALMQGKDNPNIGVDEHRPPHFQELYATIDSLNIVNEGADSLLRSSSAIISFVKDIYRQLEIIRDNGLAITPETLMTLDVKKRHELSTLVKKMSGVNRLLNYTVDASVETYNMAVHQLDALAEDYGAAMVDNNTGTAPDELPEVLNTWSSDVIGLGDE